jgi:hypothetical protein
MLSNMRQGVTLLLCLGLFMSTINGCNYDFIPDESPKQTICEAEVFHNTRAVFSSETALESDEQPDEVFPSDDKGSTSFDLLQRDNFVESPDRQLFAPDSLESSAPEPSNDAKFDDEDDEFFIPNGSSGIASNASFFKRHFSEIKDSDLTSKQREEDLESATTNSQRSSSTSQWELQDISCEESCTEDLESEMAESEPLFSHNAGLRNHNLNCYASSLLSCLYSIPLVQRAFYRELEVLPADEPLKKDESIIAAVSTVFYKMRHLNSMISLDSYFAAALSKSIGWTFGEIECVLEFWTMLGGVFPEGISGLFRIRSQENHYRTVDNVLIKSVPQESNLIFAYPQQYNSIDELIAANFLDHTNKEYIIDPADQYEYLHLLSEPISEKLAISSHTTCTILDLPDVLCFGVQRIKWNNQSGDPECNFSRFKFSPSIEINSEEYTLFGNIIYDSKRVHYFAHVFDPISREWYQHDDHKVSRIPKTESAIKSRKNNLYHRSTMVFYVKTALLGDFKIPSNWDVPEQVATKLAARHIATKSTTQASLRKRNRSEEKAEKSSPSIPREAEKCKPLAITANQGQEAESDDAIHLKKKPRKRLEPKTKGVSTSINPDNIMVKPQVSKTKPISTISKPKPSLATQHAPIPRKRNIFELFKPNFILGNESYSFDPQNRSLAVETILAVLSRNSRVVTSLLVFAALPDVDTTSVQFQIILVILEMLTGTQNIKTEELYRQLSSEYGLNLRTSNVAKLFKTISALLPQEIAPLPTVKVMTYDQDEPIEILEIEKCDFATIKPSELTPAATHLHIPGVMFDKNIEETKLINRRVFKTTGLLLAVEVKRFISEGVFDPSPINYYSSDYDFFGYLGINPETRNPFGALLDHNNLKRVHIISKGLLRSIHVSPDSIQCVKTGLSFQSTLLLFTPKHQKPIPMPKFSSIPRKLLDELEKTLLPELYK